MRASSDTTHRKSFLVKEQPFTIARPSTIGPANFSHVLQCPLRIALMTRRDETRRPTRRTGKGERERGYKSGREKIEFDISVRFSSVARARVKISACFPPSCASRAKRGFLICPCLARVPPLPSSTLFPPLIPPSRVKGGGGRGMSQGGRRRKRGEREECEMAAAARYPEAGPEKVVGEASQEARD